MSGHLVRSILWRQLGNVLLTLCVSLLVTLILMWSRSYAVNDAWTYRHMHTAANGANSVRVLGVWWARGSMVLHYDRWRIFTHIVPNPHSLRWTRHPSSTVADGLVALNPKLLPLGFGYASDTSGASSRAIVVPSWPPVFVLLLPAVWLGRRSYVSWRRNRLGLCARCGYDLRASAEKCPECGAAIAAPVPHAARDVATPH